MTIHKIQRGRYAGGIAVLATLKTMVVGEEWHITEPVNLRTIRNMCSVLNCKTERRFECHCPGIDEPYINVIRTK